MTSREPQRLRVVAPHGLVEFVQELRQRGLVVVHSHFRPGGVRRVIERALPALAASPAAGLGLDEIVLLAGEAPDGTWLDQLERRLHPMPIRWVANQSVGYVPEQRSPSKDRLTQLRRLLSQGFGTRPGQGLLVWLHNPGLARNPDVARELVRWCELRGIPLGLASNAQAYTPPELAKGLAEHGLALDLFQPAICFWSFEHGFSKHDPHVFQFLTTPLRLRRAAPGRILMVGVNADSKTG